MRILGLLLIATLAGCAAPPVDGAIDTIAFGSCARSDWPQPIWDRVAETAPDVFVLLGDNMYADVPTPPKSIEDIRAKYTEAAAIPEFARFRTQVPVLATWDDHDYGLNDAGLEWHLKAESQQAFLDFVGEPEASARRARKGIYDAKTFGTPGRRVQILLLDTRYHRTALAKASAPEPGYGPYTTIDTGTVLGDEQWTWLEARLREPAELRILASSIQVVADGHGWETWGNMPHERDRLYALIRDTNAHGVLFISGDRHLVEISADEERGPYPMWDFTSSGLNQDEPHPIQPNRFRRGSVHRAINFGVIDVDWDQTDPEICLRGVGGNGETLVTQTIRLSALR